MLINHATIRKIVDSGSISRVLAIKIIRASYNIELCYTHMHVLITLSFASEN